MSPACRIMVVDDHPIFREGLILSLSSKLSDCSWVGEAATAKSALAMMTEQQPDLVILDLILSAGSGLDVVRQMRSQNMKPKILVLTQLNDPKTDRELRQLQVEAVVSKLSPLEVVVDAIHALRSGLSFTGPSAPGLPENEVYESSTLNKPNLTAREIEIVRLVATGQTQKEIAVALGCAPETVKTHKGNLLRKLGARNSAEIVAWATKTGLI